MDVQHTGGEGAIEGTLAEARLAPGEGVAADGAAYLSTQASTKLLGDDPLARKW